MSYYPPQGGGPNDPYGQQPGGYGQQPDPYGGQTSGSGYGDPYNPSSGPGYGQDPYGQTSGSGYDPYGQQFNQPAGYGAPGFGGPPPPPPKKKLGGGAIAGIIVGAVLVLAVCCGGGLFLIAASDDDGGDTVTTGGTRTPTAAPTTAAPTDSTTEPTPSASGSTFRRESPVTNAQTGDCVKANPGNAQEALPAQCTDGGAYKVVKRFDGTSDTRKCEAYAASSTYYWNDFYDDDNDFVLCLEPTSG